MAQSVRTLKDIKSHVSNGGEIVHINGHTIAHIDYGSKINDTVRVRYEYETHHQYVLIEDIRLI